MKKSWKRRTKGVKEERRKRKEKELSIIITITKMREVGLKSERTRKNRKIM